MRPSQNSLVASYRCPLSLITHQRHDQKYGVLAISLGYIKTLSNKSDIRLDKIITDQKYMNKKFNAAEGANIKILNLC